MDGKLKALVCRLDGGLVPYSYVWVPYGRDFEDHTGNRVPHLIKLPDGRHAYLTQGTSLVYEAVYVLAPVANAEPADLGLGPTSKP